MSTFGKRLASRYALESDELGTGEGSEAEVVIDPVETGETAVAEVAQTDAEVVEETAELESLEDTHESLEAIHFALESAVRDGGLSSQSAVAYGHALTAAARRHGYRKGDTPALESIGGAATAYHGTVALEADVGKMLSDFWAAIWAQLVKVYNSIKGWFIKIMDATPKIKERAVALGNKADNTKGTASEAEVELSLVNDLGIAGKPPTSTQLAEGLGHIKTLSTSLTTTVKESEEPLAKTTAALKALSGGKVDQAAIDAVKVVIDTKLGKYSTPGESDGKAMKADRFGDDITIRSSAEFLGNAATLIKSMNNFDKEGKAVALSKVVKCSGPVIGVYNPDLKAENKQKFAVLTQERVKEISTEIVAACDKITAYKAVWQKRSEQFNAMDKEAKAAVASAKKTAEGDDKSKFIASVKDITSAQTQIWRVWVNFENQIISYLFKTSRALFTYSDKSLGMYKVAEADKGETKPA